MTKFSALAAAFWIALSGTAQAQSQPVVIELFTSQGCSSCPPADALMHELVKRDDVLALSMHVDYWDYIGWKDIFASPSNTARQQSYAKAAGRRSVYTPQMIVGGVDSVVGTHPKDVASLIAKHTAQDKDVSLDVSRDDDMVTIAATAKQAGQYEVKFVNYRAAQTVEIKRGENAGRTITYVNVVSDFGTIQEWDGSTPLAISAQVGTGPAAILIQRANHGAIEAAATIN
ncbi:DUF1223 domain-containing protein [Planktotalea sp.]|uniref:DUF1223 domain-containing protein n=1 Tax=Planktotalea sp. TaxID=2029877 RepID=UPI0032999B28